MSVTNATIRAANRLTARWADETGDGTVFSATGAWPLLAFLADGAGGTARVELADAVGIAADESAFAARELLRAIGSMPGLDATLGLWTKRTLELRDEWTAGLPAVAHGVLTGDPVADKGTLDAWAAKRTGGLIEEMPVPLTADTELVLASALALRTRWLRPFVERLWMPENGPWHGQELLGLSRRSALLDRVGVADTHAGHVTELKVLGNNAVDVHLLLGEERMTPGQVLAGGYPVTPGPRLPYGDLGPGLRVVKERATRPRPPTLDVRTVAYEVRASHDLLDHHEVFGLTKAMPKRLPGHFPGISDFPLATHA